MRTLLTAVVSTLAVSLFSSCTTEPAGPGTTVGYNDSVAVDAPVWAVGTMGGLKQISMALDSVVGAVDLGYDIYGLAAACGPYVYMGDGMSPGVKRVAFPAGTVTEVSATVTAPSGRAIGLEAAAGRVWMIGRGSKTLFGIDTAASVMDLEIPLGADTGGCASFCPAGGTMYVVTRRPLIVHAVDLRTFTVTASLPVDSGSDSLGNATVGFTGTEVHVYIAGRKELVAVNQGLTAVLRRIDVTEVVNTNERLCASSAGTFLSQRSGAAHEVLRISPVTGAVEGRFTLAAGSESLVQADVFGQRLFAVLINSVFGQNAVVELDPVTMLPLHRIEHVYVTDISVERGR